MQLHNMLQTMGRINAISWRDSAIGKQCFLSALCDGRSRRSIPGPRHKPTWTSILFSESESQRPWMLLCGLENAHLCPSQWHLPRGLFVPTSLLTVEPVVDNVEYASAVGHTKQAARDAAAWQVLRSMSAAT